jgi:hypothetical protein
VPRHHALESTAPQLAVRYRRWRNAVAAGEVLGEARVAMQTMAAGTLFTVESDDEAAAAGSSSDGGGASSGGGGPMDSVLEGAAEGFADDIERLAVRTQERA